MEVHLGTTTCAIKANFKFPPLSRAMGGIGVVTLGVKNHFLNCPNLYLLLRSLYRSGWSGTARVNLDSEDSGETETKMSPPAPVPSPDSPRPSRSLAVMHALEMIKFGYLSVTNLFLFRCVHASLLEGPSVRRSVRPWSAFFLNMAEIA